MQTVYDTLKHFAFILGDTDKALPVHKRQLHRGLKVKGTNEKNLPVFEDVPYILQSWVTADPAGEQKHGAFSLALPAYTQGEGPDNMVLRILNKGGVSENRFKPIVDWQLPAGGKEIAPDTYGVVIVGTDPDKESKIFFPADGSLVADHRGPDATQASTIVRDLDKDGFTGLKALLAKALWVTTVPPEIDEDIRSTVAINSFSMGVRKGKNVEHQGGAFMLYNSNLKTAAKGIFPRAVAWSAWLDDGPFWEGEGHQDFHIKGVDEEGMPHIPLMFEKTKAKYGPGPERTPAAPWNFLEQFASKPRYSLHVFRGEIKYDAALRHKNPSGQNKEVPGRWVVEYRLHHKNPPPPGEGDPSYLQSEKEDPSGKGGDPSYLQVEKGDPVYKGGDPGNLNPEKVPVPILPPEEPVPVDKPPGEGDGDPDPVIDGPGIIEGGQAGPVGGMPPPGIGPQPDGGSIDPDRDYGLPGPGASDESPGTCGSEDGTPAQEPGPGSGDSFPLPHHPELEGEGFPGATDDGGIGEGKLNAALDQFGSGALYNAAPNLAQSNIVGRSVASVAFMQSVVGSNKIHRAPMTSSMAVAYPVITPHIPSVSFERARRATYRSNLTSREQRNVDSWGLGGTSLFAFGDASLDREPQTINRGNPIVRGGFIVAGSDLFPEEIYGDVESNLEAIFAIRSEGKIVFGNPDEVADGNITEGHVVEREDDELVYRFQDANGPTNLDAAFHFKTPVRITNVTTAERGAMTAKEGNIVLDTDENVMYARINGAWADLSSGGSGFLVASNNLSDLGDVPEARTNLGLGTMAVESADDYYDESEIDSIVAGLQPLDAELSAIAGLASAANTLPMFTGSGTASLINVTTFAQSLLDDANATTARSTLGVYSTAQVNSLLGAYVPIASHPAHGEWEYSEKSNVEGGNTLEIAISSESGEDQTRAIDIEIHANGVDTVEDGTDYGFFRKIHVLLRETSAVLTVEDYNIDDTVDTTAAAGATINTTPIISGNNLVLEIVNTNAATCWQHVRYRGHLSQSDTWKVTQSA